MERPKRLRFSPDEGRLLDTLRQYLSPGSETEATAQGLVVLGEQLLATYLAQGIYPQRCLVLLGALCAAVQPSETQPRYQVAKDRRTLLRWHAPTGRYLPIEPGSWPWLEPSEE